jgi:cysteine desulfurase
VQPDGLLDQELLEKALGDDVALVSIMAVNNEIGVIQNIAGISQMVRSCGALFHSDIAQGFGKIPLSAGDFDLASISGHKIYGPKGIGALFRREGVKLRAQMTGGGQEADLRSGTLSPALCVGLGAAAVLPLSDSSHMEALFKSALAHLIDFPLIWQINGSHEQRYFGNVNVTLKGIDAGRLLSDARGIMLSSGAACAASAGRLSHVLAALGLNDEAVRSSIRMGFGTMTTLDDISVAIECLRDAVKLQLKNKL